MAETLEISLKADIRELQKALEKLPEIGAKEARDMVRGLQREYRKAERAAKKAAKETEKAFKDGFAGVGKIAKTFEGQVGGAFSVIEDFTEGLAQMGGVVGPVGLAVGGLGLAATAAGFAYVGAAQHLKAFSDGAVEARDRLREMDELWGIPPHALDAVRNYELANKELTVAIDRLHVTVGGQFLDDLAVIAHLFAGIAESAAELEDPLGGVTTMLSGLVATTFGTVANGTMTALGGIATAATASTRAELEHTAAVEEETAMLEALGIVVDDVVWGKDKLRRAAEEAAEAEREAAKAQREAIAAAREFERATKSLEKITRDAHSDIGGKIGEVQHRYEELRIQVRELQGDEQARAAAISALNERELREIQKIKDVLAAKASEEALQAHIRARESAEFTASLEETKVAAEEALAGLPEGAEVAALAIAQKLVPAFGAVQGVVTDITGSLQQLNDMEIAALQERAAAQVDAAMRSAEAWQEAQLARIDRELETGRISEKEAAAERRRIGQEMREREKAANALKRDEKKAAMASFRANKQLARFEAIMGAARNAIVLTPAFVGLAGPGAPLAAAASASAALAPQLAIINRQKPPEFPGGGMVSTDHIPVGMQLGEGAVTRTGMSLLGEDGLDRLNSGQRPGSDRFVVKLGHSTLVEAVRRVKGQARDVLLDPRLGRTDPFGDAT